MITAIFWSALATLTLLIGMGLAYRNLVSDRWTGLIMAFGAGAIISAAAYQLVLGAAVEDQSNELVVGLAIAAGALTFYFADKWVDSLGGKDRMDMDGAQSGGSGTGILLALCWMGFLNPWCWAFRWCIPLRYRWRSFLLSQSATSHRAWVAQRACLRVVGPGAKLPASGWLSAA